MALVREPQLVKYQDLCALDSAIVGSNELRLASWSMPLSVKASINRDSGLSNETGRDRDGWAASYESAFFSVYSCWYDYHYFSNSQRIFFIVSLIREKLKK